MEERIRCTKATLKSLKEKRIFDPINPKEIPRPSKKEIITAKEGRNAKVAWVNKHYLQAIKSYTQVLILNPKLALKKVKSFFFR
jgi:hypothetical protein